MNLEGWQLFGNAFSQAFGFLTANTIDVWSIVFVSLKVSFSAVGLALVVGIPIGFFLGTRHSVSRGVGLVLANAGMGLPPTVVGLFVSMLLSRRGPLGDLSLLYSQPAMVIAQLVIATPVVAAITATAVSAVPAELRLQARSLGASRLQEVLLMLRESRMGIFAAVAAGFGSVISEVGAVQMVGGNLVGQTQVMTTAIVQYTRMGKYGMAVALGMVLLGIVVLVNILLTAAQTSNERYTKEVG